jgi:death-on-curing protein
MIWLPTVRALEEAHFGVVKMFENQDDPVSPAGVKSPDMLESACMRPHTGAGDYEKYTTVFSKAGALFHSLTKNHPFHNGNKRTAVVALLTVLHRNKRRLSQDVTDDTLYDFAVDVTADEFPVRGTKLAPDDMVDAIATWLRDNSVPLNSSSPGMKVNDFIAKCASAGARYKEARGGNHHLQNNGGSISFQMSTKQLDGRVIKNYLRRLGMNEVAGIGFDEFADGTSGERLEIYRYMATLKRLAKT